MLCNYFFNVDMTAFLQMLEAESCHLKTKRNMAISVWWAFFSWLTVRLLSFLFISLVVEDYFFSSLEALFSSLLIQHTKELWLLCPAAPLERNDIEGSIRSCRNYVVLGLPTCIRVKIKLDWTYLSSLWFWNIEGWMIFL